ncbi:MAG: glycosyltransferase [Candidatus Amulumruptor caecigallinarius]|nr:glycosyltransferase [Candidatus Amulumruptor caecigallinarius]
MMGEVLFSIIVPVYKVEKYLARCVDSLLAQDFDDYEIVLVDDGSPDACPALCDEYAAAHERVKSVHKPNGGLSDARNFGVGVSSGKYITFVDSDDFWEGRDVLLRINDLVKRYNPDIVVSDFIKYYEASDSFLYPQTVGEQAPNGKSAPEMLQYFYFKCADLRIAAWQKFVRRELAMAHPFTKGLLSEDIDWTFSIYPEAKTITECDTPYYCYRQQREGSITNSNAAKRIDNLFTIIDKWEEPLLRMRTDEAGREIYLGYLAYQLSIIMLIANSLQRDEKERVLERIKQHKHLFRYKTNAKTSKVRMLVRVVGIRAAMKVMKLYYDRREKLAIKKV